MKKVISLFLVTAMMLAMFTVSFSAVYSVSDLDDEGKPLVISVSEALAANLEETGEEIETARVYFLMPNGKRGKAAESDHSITLEDYEDEIDPETGEVIGQVVVGTHDEVVIHAGDKAPSWYSDYNVLDGKNYAGIYWWGGSIDPEHNYTNGWCGYRADIADYDQGIYYADIPTDVTTIIWNNGVDGGMDSSKPIYYEAAQTVDTNSEGAYPGDYETLIDGTPDEYTFDNCIYVINPDQVDVNPLTNKQTCGADWYNYYGNGCYGSVFDGGESGEFTTAEECCLNPNHWKNGAHVGYYEEGGEHTHTPAEPVRENEVAATYKSEGSYDEVVYCSDCGEEISRETKTIPVIELDSSKLYFDATTTGWEMGSKNKIAFHIFGGDLTNGLDWGAKKSIGTATAGADGLFEIDPAAKQGYSFTPGVQYKIIFVRTDGANWKEQTYDLLFTTDCFGHVAFCDGTEYENPVDSTKKTLAAFWYGMDAAEYGPVLQISSIGNVVGTCPEAGKTPESIFNDFISVVDSTTGVTMLANARKYVVDVNTKTEQQLIDDIGTDLGLTKQQVYNAFNTNEIETTWDAAVSTLPGEIVVPTEHTHTPGEPVQENVKAASCKAEGSYDEVVYCTECGEELSRETKTIAKLAHTPADAVRENIVASTCTVKGTYEAVVYCSVCGEELSRTKNNLKLKAHTIEAVPAKEATATEDGYKAHYTCTVCGKLFSDATGTTEVTMADLVVKYVAPTEADKPTEAKPEGKLGDVDNNGEVDIVDVTLIQRIEVGIKTADAAMKTRADVDKDGEVTIIDATRVQRFLVGLDDALGIGAAL